MKKKDFIDKCRKEKKLCSNFPDYMNEKEKLEIRREVLKKLTKVKLDSLDKGFKVLEKSRNRNIENAVGCVRVPLGIAGPLRLHSHSKSSGQAGQAKKEKEYFIPLATTEGALVASLNRGCKAIFRSGEARVWVEDRGITRAPVFKASNIQKAKDFVRWVSKNDEELKKICEKTSKHLKFLDIFPKIVGRNVFLRLRFKTDEAMGMNMATIAADKMVKFIEKKTDVKCKSLSSNFCSDKKAAAVNNILGRGKEVWAEAEITDTVLREVLKTNREKIIDVAYRKLMLGSAVSSSMALNAHFANVVAAIFLATGQDIAHVVEGSMGITTVEESRQGVYISIYMPSLILGTVGGGTHLPDQRKALEIMGLGKGRSGEAIELAEIIGAAVLAGELSLLSSLAEGSLAKVHKKLGQSGGKK